MRMTVGMLRQIIREEVSRNLMRENAEAFASLESEAKSVDEEIKKLAGEVIRALGKNPISREIRKFVGGPGGIHRFASTIEVVSNPRQKSENSADVWKMESKKLRLQIQELKNMIPQNQDDLDAVADQLLEIVDIASSFFEKLVDAAPEEWTTSSKPFSEK